MFPRNSRSLLRRMLRPLAWPPALAGCVLMVGVATAAAGGPRPDAPPTPPRPVRRSRRLRPSRGPRPRRRRVRPAAGVRAPVTVARAHSTTSPTPAHHVEATPQRQCHQATTTTTVLPSPQPRRAREMNKRLVPLVRLPLVPSLHPEAAGGGSAGSSSLVALAAGLLLLGGCSHSRSPSRSCGGSRHEATRSGASGRLCGDPGDGVRRGGRVRRHPTPDHVRDRGQAGRQRLVRRPDDRSLERLRPGVRDQGVVGLRRGRSRRHHRHAADLQRHESRRRLEQRVGRGEGRLDAAVSHRLVRRQAAGRRHLVRAAGDVRIRGQRRYLRPRRLPARSRTKVPRQRRRCGLGNLHRPGRQRQRRGERDAALRRHRAGAARRHRPVGQRPGHRALDAAPAVGMGGDRPLGHR